MQMIRLGPDDDLSPVHRLLTGAFAYMDGVIDPPSSLARMGPEAFARAARDGELWVLRDPGLVACMVLNPRDDHLYLGKLAVTDAHRGRGIARQMIAHAAARARALNLPRLRLQTRVELTGNHAAFARMGFSEVGRSAHAGYDAPTSITFERRI